jgi:hypothetical protein
MKIFHVQFSFPDGMVPEGSEAGARILLQSLDPGKSRDIDIAEHRRAWR